MGRLKKKSGVKVIPTTTRYAVFNLAFIFSVKKTCSEAEISLSLQHLEEANRQRRMLVRHNHGANASSAIVVGSSSSSCGCATRVAACCTHIKDVRVGHGRWARHCSDGGDSFEC